MLEAYQSVDQSKNGVVLILVPLQFIHGIMYQSIPSLTIPPPGNFFDGRIPHPPRKKRVQNPDPPGL